MCSGVAWRGGPMMGFGLTLHQYTGWALTPQLAFLYQHDRDKGTCPRGTHLRLRGDAGQTPADGTAFLLGQCSALERGRMGLWRRVCRPDTGSGWCRDCLEAQTRLFLPRVAEPRNCSYLGSRDWHWAGCSHGFPCGSQPRPHSRAGEWCSSTFPVAEAPSSVSQVRHRQAKPPMGV